MGTIDQGEYKLKNKVKVHTNVVLQQVRNDQGSQILLTSQSKRVPNLLPVSIALNFSIRTKGQCCVLYPFRNPHLLGNSIFSKY